MNESKSTLSIGAVFILLLIGALIGFQLGRWSNYYDSKPKISPTGASCTLEVKLCPDGSSVGRSGPNCEFAESPLFAPTPTTVLTTKSPKEGCVTAGCSGQLCVPISQSDMISTCEMKEEYSCLQYSSCELQQDGICGWTQTPEYSQCLRDLK
ncbi:hypothetical protein A2954_00455 [Candidatus Roizmanbacteria bacterium RIFCSPLOWO2_01_FULL_37_12]|uniref:Kazal-like domain-containing protein n=1 Tax=Candidatus Roizmanbacteria bacterium RIFCSPLOWO2_01_FULL_37_12 TaxID=1802056 RepID=A0A1F7ICX4_9BACT|nr:MAG: hypothetical protein A2768_00090 [Candidatus Roizmanbacteria bacterium RIFCSPHIGHO2_01_FULL_37_16]OGK23294.1 MAG: hypothetical protein A3D76_00750 [Candidatus Roizmanbacteria bacterium RIFCSPHIGHO2_02_FULL_37_9b]OGK41209.1 MAG: hypothetical protein A2954_00455 [Candidatus Roizmanbacteria bacterium RIFCSPLOWO2_01_FULL_37_12]